MAISTDSLRPRTDRRCAPGRPLVGHRCCRKRNNSRSCRLWRQMPCSVGEDCSRIVRVETQAQSAAMDANNPITAALFSAFLKCPTKAHLIAIGEPAPGTQFIDIEAIISSMYKAAAKQQSPIAAGVAEFLDFRERWRTL